MSAIDTGIVSSVLGSAGAQRSSAAVDDAARNDAADASRLASGGDVILEVEGTEDDKVNTDSEGSGGSGRQGRWDDAPDDEAAASPDATPPGHLDLTA